MSALSFPEFFEACHGHAPLPWQKRLAGQLCSTHSWPDLIDLPTASGKTACMDIALFHLAYCSMIGKPQLAARRIAFVVDRRIIVDAAAERADKLVKLLSESTHVAIVAVANALLRCGGQTALESHKLRGGMAKERNFAHCPAQPMLISSTVDQIGSRLLFRGYGIKDYSLSLHAGLLGHDTLVLLDEAHLSRAMLSSVQALRHQQQRATASLSLQSVRVVPLSATAQSSGMRFQLDVDDFAHPLIQQRQRCAKPVQLVICEKAKERPKALFDAAVRLLTELQANAATPAIAIVVNRVATARAVFELLSSKLKTKPMLELMIGRSRPLDRDAISKRLIARCAAGRNAAADDQPFIVVATQCIEVGADLDFQGMISECAALDALRQRFGRLDRLGTFGKARSVIVGGGDAEDDPVYGSALTKTWGWLQAQDESLDFGIQALATRLLNVDIATLIAPIRAQLQLTPSFMGLLSQTSPRPQYDPDIAALLHGLSDAQEDVRIIWRESLAGLKSNEASLVSEILEAQRPSSMETMSLSPRAVRHWLSHLDASDYLIDVEGADVAAEEFKLRLGKQSPIWRQDRKGFKAISKVDEVKPGDLLVLSDHGGCDAFGFAPDSNEPVKDLSRQARAMLASTQQPVELITLARLNAEVNTMLEIDPGHVEAQRIKSVLLDLKADEISARDASRQLKRALRAAVAGGAFAQETCAIATPISDVQLLWQRDDALFGLLLYFGKPKRDDLSEDDDSSNMIRQLILLEDHNRGVGQRALAHAAMVGLHSALQQDLALAGHVHDLGKAEPRFQRMLRAGLDAEVDANALLAKGLAKKGAKVTMGARHEAYSVAVLQAHPELLASAHDPELVLHLVGSHHGRGRALQPDVIDPGCRFNVPHNGVRYSYVGAPNLGAIGGANADRFNALQLRYGTHGLAYLEALLRISDYQQSNAESESGGEPKATSLGGKV